MDADDTIAAEDAILFGDDDDDEGAEDVSDPFADLDDHSKCLICFSVENIFKWIHAITPTRAHTNTSASVIYYTHTHVMFFAFLRESCGNT